MADRNVTVNLRADISQYQRQLAAAAATTAAFGKNTSGAGKEIDKLSGRLRLAADAASTLGLAIGPLGAAAVGGVVAMAAQLGALAGAMGVTLLAVNGLGDGLKALDKYQLEPTTENLKKLNDEMKSLGPAGEDFVRFLDSIEPNLKTLQNAAREGLLPGAQEGIESLMQRLPELRKLIRGMAEGLGDLSADAGKALAGERWDAFFKYLRTDGIKILDDTSRTLGKLAEAAANTFVAFGGVSSDFSGGLLKFSEGLAEASANLDSNAGIQEFLRYIETEGPHALETLGSLGNAILQIVEATAPLGGPALTIIGQFADALAKIADSDIGTPLFAAIAALALFNRSVQLTQKLVTATWGPGVAAVKSYTVALSTVVTAQDRATMSAKQLAAAELQRDRAQGLLLKNAGRGAALAGGLAIAMSGVADSTGLANTAMLSMAGPWGAAAGFALDLWNATDGLQAAMASLDGAMASGDIDQMTAALENANAELEKTRANTILGTDVFGDFAGSVVNTIAPASNMAKFMGTLTGDTEDLASAAEDAAKALENQKNGVNTLVAPLAGLRVGLEQAAEAADAQATANAAAVESMFDMKDAALGAFDAITNYRQAMKDAAAQAKTNSEGIKGSSENMLKNREALSHLIGAWNGLDQTVTDNVGKFRAARENFLRTAEAMGVSAAEARRLWQEMAKIPTKRVIDVTTPGMDEATSKAKTLQQILNSLHSKDINIALHYQTLGNKPPVLAGQQPGGADGMTVPGPRHPYGDKMTIRVAPGEEIISNRHGQADRFRADRAAGRIPGYANGGTAGGGPWHAVDNSGPWHVVDSVTVALKKLKVALEKAEKSLDKERQTRDDIASQRDAFMSQVGGAYSSLDPFAMAQATGSGWGAGSGANPLGSFDAALSGNIASTKAAQDALAFAQSHGLDGPLYAALAASGNLPLLQAFAQLSAGEIETRELQFAAQSNAQSALGTSAAAGAGMTAQLRDANKHLGKLQDEVKGLRHDVKVASDRADRAADRNADKVGDKVNGAASNGHKRGK